MKRVSRSPLVELRRSKVRSGSESSDRDHECSEKYEPCSKMSKSRSKSRDQQNGRRESYSSGKADRSEDLDSNRRVRRRRSHSRSGVGRTRCSVSRGYPDTYYRSHSRRQSFDKRSRSRSRSSSSGTTDSKNWKKRASVTGTGWKATNSPGNTADEEKLLTECDLEGKSADEIAMMKVMGFCNFDSTNGKQVEGNMVSSVFQTITRRKYRQYMNRKGGFNRPLDFTL